MNWRTAILSFAVVVAAHRAAHAHAFLTHATPAAGNVLAASPRTVTLDFSEDLEPRFCGITVTDASGHDLAAGPTVIKNARIVVPVRPLRAGTYRVSWHVVSVDTHRTEGAYSFAVAQ